MSKYIVYIFFHRITAVEKIYKYMPAEHKFENLVFSRHLPEIQGLAVFSELNYFINLNSFFCPSFMWNLLWNVFDIFDFGFQKRSLNISLLLL